MSVRVAVFASGGGTNLQALLDRYREGYNHHRRKTHLAGMTPAIMARLRPWLCALPTAVKCCSPGSSRLRTTKPRRGRSSCRFPRQDGAAEKVTFVRSPERIMRPSHAPSCAF